jgi:hypothetical protein
MPQFELGTIILTEKKVLLYFGLHISYNNNNNGGDHDDDNIIIKSEHNYQI